MSGIPVAVFKSFEQSEQLVDQLADKIANLLQDAVDLRGRASLVVSGGSTPLPLFRKLSNIGIEWQAVSVTLADERWLAASDAESNERLVREHLLQGKAASARFCGLVTADATPEQGVQLATENLAAVPMPFDVVILGMGNDGHTASLFPCSAELDEALATQAKLIAVNPTKAPHGRISLSLTALLNSKQIFLHLTGNEKREVLERAYSSRDVKQMPIRAVLDQKQTPVDVYWSQQK